MVKLTKVEVKCEEAEDLEMLIDFLENQELVTVEYEADNEGNVTITSYWEDKDLNPLLLQLAAHIGH